jgi:hypothetical protein
MIDCQQRRSVSPSRFAMSSRRFAVTALVLSLLSLFLFSPSAALYPPDSTVLEVINYSVLSSSGTASWPYMFAARSFTA